MKLEDTTPAQHAAITTKENEVVAVAGPGSGKTATLVERIVYVIRAGAAPESIAILTFTNVGANELARRLEARLPGTKPGFLGTLHSFCLRMLRDHGSAFGYGERVALISPESAADLLESKARSLNCKAPVKDLLALKREGRPNIDTRVDIKATAVAGYFDDLREAGVVDYDALLSEFLHILRGVSDSALAVDAALSARFSHLFVDESQDSALIDWMIYRSLPIRNKFFVGDPDQSIFAFRGASVSELIAQTKRVSGGPIYLEANFRSHEEICAGAQRLITHNTNRVDKATISQIGKGGKIFVPEPCANEGDEIAKVCRTIVAINKGAPFGIAVKSSTVVAGENIVEVKPVPQLTIAILAPTNQIADGFRRTLVHSGIDVVSIERKPLPPDWRLARAFIELVANPENDTLAFMYLVARFEKNGANPKEAREAAHAARRTAAAAGRSLNSANIHAPRITAPENAVKALADQPVSKEALRLAIEKFQDLPPGSAMLEFTVSLAECREIERESKDPGVHVGTIHGAKGREFDVVFLVGFEEEVIPGRARLLTDPIAQEAGIEEARRVAYVGLTRARKEVYITSAKSRAVVFGAHREIKARTPSRFTAEIVGGAA